MASSGPIIVEGDGILPSVAAQTWIDGANAIGRVRAVFLDEPDESQLLITMLRRFHQDDAVATEEDQNIARMHWLYGEWLRQEADHRGLPALTARPYEALVSRVLAMIA